MIRATIKKSKFIRGLLTLCLTASTAFTLTQSVAINVKADTTNWNLVWSDEFNESQLDTTKWNYEVNGDGGGNNELQYYTSRPENLYLSNGLLNIVARRESYGGKQYTSARINTKGKAEFSYGKIEARMKLPVGKGVWPAFWMLGSNIDDAHWPGCGEIDVMENLGQQPNTIYGTLHGPGYSGSGGLQSKYVSSDSAFSNGFHTYSVEWEPDKISFYVDGNFYGTKTRSDAGSNDWVFNDKKFFMILNLAIGGGWPGDPDGSAQFPLTYSVDYVRVYKAATSPTTDPVILRAENYSSQSGVQKEPCSEGGQDIGYIDAGDWMAFNSVNLPVSGEYKVEYRVASQNGGGVISLEKAGGSTVYGTLDVPATGGWQNWQTISHIVKLDAGTQAIGIGVPKGGYNISWIKFVPIVTLRAENYSSMSGVQKESCSEGGQDVGYIDSGDWMAFYPVNLPISGRYKVEYRVASQNGGGVISLEKAGGSTIYGTIGVPATGGWQNWQTISNEVTLDAGTQAIGIGVPKGGYNISWIKFTPISD